MIRVKREILILLSGLIWSIIGVLLNFMAARWMVHLYFWEGAGVIIIGLISGFLIAYLGFIKMIRKNTDRILKYEGKVCVFAFQSWKSYLIIIIMVTLGIFMRSSSLVPKLILTPIYIGIGLALIISSSQYYRAYMKARSMKPEA
ncbi:MAG: hypothetical protein K8S00_11640 [Bacteroidales bacterium]|nr:hypothetical protein [Bacteroidales bacterium]